MKEDRIFVDTNVIVYAHDVSSWEKHGKAMEIMNALWNNGNGMTSTQVLQELFVTATKKLVRPLDVLTAKEIVRDLLTWKTIVFDGAMILDAIDIHTRYQYQNPPSKLDILPDRIFSRRFRPDFS